MLSTNSKPQNSKFYKGISSGSSRMFPSDPRVSLDVISQKAYKLKNHPYSIQVPGISFGTCRALYSLILGGVFYE